MKKFLTFLSALILSFSALAQDVVYDVVIYGGNSSGVIAAYSAARTKLKVALIEQTQHIGGLTTSGIGHIDIGWPQTVGGYTGEFLRRAGKHYGKNAMAIDIECSVCEKIFKEMLAETDVDVFYQTRLRPKDGVRKDGTTITGIVMEDGREFRARTFIDASYEGDLMAQAGVTYIVGREPADLYGESAAGVQSYKTLTVLSRGQLDTVLMLRRRFPMDVVPGEKLAKGAGDGKSQAYVYRLCVTDNPDNRVAFPKPANYVPDRYLLKLRGIQRRNLTKFKQVLTLYPLPNHKYDLNHMDLLNASWSYPEGDYATRKMIDEYHKVYQQGYLYFLANDPRVPAALQEDVRRYGLAKDEFTDNGNWPYQLYIREGRRMVGEYVMKQFDAWDRPHKDDAVAIGSYFLDCHLVSSILTKEGKIEEEGVFENTPYRPYQIPYRSIVPRKDQCTNLLVTSCISASHVIYASLRMEPVYMMLGQAAAAASSLAIGKGTTVQNVNIGELQALLKQQGQIISYDPPANMYLRQQDYDGIVLDDTNAMVSGNWGHSVAQGPFMKVDYLFVPSHKNGTATVTYNPFIEEKGSYEVFVMYAAGANRCGSVPVTVIDRKGSHTVYVNQKTAPSDGEWESLGIFEFAPDKEHKVIIGNRSESQGVVIADGVRVVRKEKGGKKAASLNAKAAPIVAVKVPAGEKESSLFRVEALGVKLPVYELKVSPVDRKDRLKGMDDKKNTHQFYEMAAFTYFDIPGKTTVKVSSDSDIKSVKVLPSSYGVKAEVRDGAAFVDVLPGQNLTVEINGDEYHSLHIFANEVEKEKVDRSDPDVIYFGPGVHRIGRLVVRDNQTLYVAAGAVLMCDTSDKPEGGPYHPSITLAGKNIRVCGRGIIDGSLCPNLARNLMCVEKCSNVIIEGIILRDSGVWTLPVRHSENVTIDNVKILGYRANSDGIDICNSRKVLVQNCFVRTLDDLIVLKTLQNGDECRDVTVRRNVLWNEVAHALSIGAEINHDISNVVFEDCDIIHDKGREWSLRVYHCDNALVKNVLFRKIRIEESQSFISLWINKAVWSSGNGRGHIDGVSFKDITASRVTNPVIEILGYDGTHKVENVSFSNIKVEGKSADAEMLRVNEFTDKIGKLQ